MRILDKLLAVLLVTTLATLATVQGYSIWKGLTHPAKGLRITMDVHFPSGCKLPTYAHIKQAMLAALDLGRARVREEQIHAALIQSTLTATLPAQGVTETDLSRMEQKLNGLVKCDPLDTTADPAPDVFHISSAHTFPVHAPRPLDYATFFVLLLVLVMLARSLLAGGD